MNPQRVSGAVFFSWASDLMTLPQRAGQRAWASSLPVHSDALLGLVVCFAGVVSLRDVEPFVFCSRSVQVFGYLSLITFPLNGLKFLIQPGNNEATEYVKHQDEQAQKSRFPPREPSEDGS
jgi:hypothetical protein